MYFSFCSGLCNTATCRQIAPLSDAHFLRLHLFFLSDIIRKRPRAATNSRGLNQEIRVPDYV